MDLAGPEFQSELDMSSFLRLNSAGDHLKEDEEGELPVQPAASFSRLHRWFLSSKPAFATEIFFLPSFVYFQRSHFVVAQSSEHVVFDL